MIEFKISLFLAKTANTDNGPRCKRLMIHDLPNQNVPCS